MTSDRHDGLAYMLAEPDREPLGGVVILHGAGSCKENHLDFARACAAQGLAAIAFDQRGHGASDGALGAGALDDVAAIAALLPGRGPVVLRGSSMGGFLALAAAQRAAARAVVAICPASPQLLLAGLRDGHFEFRADRAALEAVVAAADLERAARRLGPGLMLVHAHGDERVFVPGGDHRSAQHDARLQSEALRFLIERCDGA